MLPLVGYFAIHFRCRGTFTLVTLHYTALLFAFYLL